MIALTMPGDLRIELVLEQAQRTDDGAGGFVEQWIEVGLVFARIEPASAKDRFGAGQTLEDISHRITIRHRADAVSGMRLRRGARVFAILTVHDPDETGRYLVIRAREQGR
jgi:SPP1 family predicted phage head-tail adaptor